MMSNNKKIAELKPLELKERISTDMQKLYKRKRWSNYRLSPIQTRAIL